MEAEDIVIYIYPSICGIIFTVFFDLFYSRSCLLQRREKSKLTLQTAF